ncbi:MAG: GNAT family N-acetyltransferase [Bacteroidota bacterium]
MKHKEHIDLSIKLETGEDLIKRAALMVGEAFIQDATPHTLELWKAVRPENRAKRYGKVFSITLNQKNKNILIAWDKDTIVGCLCFYPSKYTQLSLRQRMKMIVPFLIASGKSFFNFLKLQALTESLLPDGDFLHLGPIAVKPSYQSKGVGSQLMKTFISIAEKEQQAVFLHTGKERNLTFYERFGFRLSEKSSFLGAPIWAMIRGINQPYSSKEC